MFDKKPTKYVRVYRLDLNAGLSDQTRLKVWTCMQYNFVIREGQSAVQASKEIFSHERANTCIQDVPQERLKTKRLFLSSQSILLSKIGG